MEFEKDTSFLSGRLKSFSFAFKCAIKLITTEHSVIVQSILGLLLVVAGIYFNISREEWMIQILATGLVISVEGLNTAAEKISDFIHPEYHEKIGFIKDIAAGAVLFAALTAIIVGLFIYVPKIM